MLGSLAVIVAAVVIQFTGWTWVDTLIAAGIGLADPPSDMDFVERKPEYSSGRNARRALAG